VSAGEAVESRYLGMRAGPTMGQEGGNDRGVILDWLSENWDQPEGGFWATRGGRKHSTYGRLMSWVAFDRAIRIAGELGRPADVPRWTAERDRIYQQIMERGWSKERPAFVQHY